MKKLIQRIRANNRLLSLLGTMTTSAVGFLSVLLLARTLTKSDFGAWFVFLTGYTMLEILRTGLLQTSLVRFTAGASEEDKRALIGSAWTVSLIFNATIIAIGLLIGFFFGHLVQNQSFVLVVHGVGWLLLVALPFNFALWILQADLQFEKMLYLRLLSLGSFMLLIMLNFFLQKGVEFIVISYFCSNAMASMLAIFAGWTDFSKIRHTSRDKINQLLGFGRYSMGTMISANLLRSSDTLIIGAMLGEHAVAVYTLPQKLFEVVEIPLRSLVATALPEMSRTMNNGDEQGLRNSFEKYTGFTTFMILPMAIGCFLFADPLMVIMGGAKYADSAHILRILSVFAIFLPLDRFCGVTLDVLNRPVLNFIKVVIMLIINVAGDYIAIVYTADVWWVAFASIITFSSGVLLGVVFLRRHLNISLNRSLSTGYAESRRFLGKFMLKLRHKNVS